MNTDRRRLCLPQTSHAQNRLGSDHTIRLRERPLLTEAQLHRVQGVLRAASRLTKRFKIVLLALAGLGLMVFSAQAQSSVTFAWDRVTTSAVAGYKLYYGAGSRLYTNALLAGNVTQRTVSGLTAGVRYFFAVTAYNTNGLESAFSSEITVSIVASRPVLGLSFPADAGVITPPFIAVAGIVSQPHETDVIGGGRAAYDFIIPSNGLYLIAAEVNAAHEGANSFYVNIDAEPTDPTMIWDVPVTTRLVTRTVTWRGNGTTYNNQFVPKVFALTDGAHQLIVRGREANTQLGTITISPTNFNVFGLPPPWKSAGIGKLDVEGSAGSSNGVYVISSAGNLSGTADNFHFVYQTLSADGEIRARLASQETGANKRAGVMIRETLTSGAEYAFMGISPNTYRWQHRATTASSTSSLTLGSASPPNLWVRLVRRGKTFSGYRSSDGVNWIRVISRNLSMASSIYIGLAVASGSANTPNLSTFSNVTVIP
jgi:regulation of enolase protein 1 (concanavalin A-like superfamily)